LAAVPSPGDTEMNKVHKSIGFSALERYGSTIFQIVALAFLARLLTPTEFGIYTTIAAFTALAGLSAREFGGANYLIQKSDLTEANIRTAFTISFAMWATLAALLFTLRESIATFYSQQDLKFGVAIAALGFLLSPFTGTLSAMLRREMQFQEIARCNLIANFITAATSVTLAALGYSFTSPIWGALTGQAVLLTLLLERRRRRFQIFIPCLAGWRDVLHFGAFSSAVTMINLLYKVSPQLILGRTLGFAAVGLYGRAVNVTEIFDRLVLEALRPVALPAFATQRRAGADLKPLYLHGVELLTAVQWPCLIFTGMMAEPIVYILLGSRWLETVPLVRILCFASLSLFAACLTYPILVAVGRVRDTLWATLIAVPPSLVIILIASFFGLQVVAASALVTLPFQAAVALYIVSRRLAIRPADLLGAMSKSALVTLTTVAGILVVVGLYGFTLSVPVIGFVGAGAAAFGGWVLGLVLTRHPLLAELQLATREIISAARPLRILRWIQVPSNARPTARRD
jgi:O-antigen/teichoic acid export membrane protein